MSDSNGAPNNDFWAKVIGEINHIIKHDLMAAYVNCLYGIYHIDFHTLPDEELEKIANMCASTIYPIVSILEKYAQ